MAIARRSTATATNATSNTTLTPAWDVVPVDGDQILVALGAIVQATITPPSGFTLLGTQDSGANLRTWFYKRPASSEPASYNWVLGTATKNWVWMGAYSDVDPATVLFQSTTGLTTPTLTVPDNGWLAAAGCGRHTNTGAATTWSSSVGTDSERLDFGSNVAASTDVSGCAYDSNGPLAAGSVSRILTPSQPESTSASALFVFGPTAGGGAPAAAGAGWGVHL